MMQWIHDRLRGWGAFILIAPLALTFAVWGVQGIVSFSSKSETALTVNGREVDSERLKRVYQEQLAQIHRMYKDEVPPEIKQRVQDSIVQEFVAETLIDMRTEKERYVVSDGDVIRGVRAVPAFQVGGQFSRDAYEGLLRQNNYTPARFEAEERRNLRDQQLEQDLRISSFALPAEFAAAASLRRETREVAYAIVPAAKYVAMLHPDESVLKAYYDAHAAQYMTPDTVQLAYVSLKLTDVAAEVAVTPAALATYYASVKDRYVAPEKRRARHLLIQSGTDDAAAKAKAQALYQEALQPGADFASLAQKNSQDAGSAAQGGELGWAEKSYFVAPFADTLFAMKAGETSQPVHTQFGWHIIQLEEIKTGEAKSLDQVHTELEADYRRVEAEKLFGERQERLDTLVFENGGSLEPAARALKLTVRTIPDFTREHGGGELRDVVKVIDAAFKTDVLAGQNSRALELRPGEVVALRVSEHRPPVQKSFAEARAEVLKAVQGELATAAATSAAEAAAQALNGGAAFKEAVKPLGATTGADPTKPAAPELVRLEPGRSVARHDPNVPPELLAAVFAAAKPADGKATVGTARLASGAAAVYAVREVKPGVAGATAPAGESREQAERFATEEMASYVATLRKSAELHYSPQIFE
jgi:peptidyl-prolyl cis-trans isomerase D